MAYVDHYSGQRRQDWRTPAALFADLDAAWHFDFDGAADGNALTDDHSTSVDMWPSWSGRRVFCNPPWSGILPFVERAPDAECAVLLVPARTNAKWFHRALELGARVGYFLGRPRFDGGKGSSPIDCLLLIWGH